MKMVLRIAGFFVCLILFFVLLLTGNIFFNLTGGILISLLGLVFLITVIAHSTLSIVYQKNKRSTNISAIVFGVLAIPVLFVPLIFNLLMQTQYSLVTGSTSPSYKIAFLSYNAIGEAIAFEKYEMQEIDGIEVYSPSFEKEKQKLINTVMDAITDNEMLFNDYFGRQSNEGLRVKMSGLLLEETHVVNGYYHQAEKQIYAQIPTKMVGWQSLYDTMVHEYAHYRFHMAVRKKGSSMEHFPFWFNEGIATHIQYIDKDININEEVFREKEWSPFDEIGFEDDWNEKVLDVRYDPYFQSKMFIDKLINQQGPDVIMEIVSLTSILGSFEQAFDITVGKSYEDFGNEVIKDIEKIAADNY